MVIVKKAYKLTQFKNHISDTQTVIMSDGDFDDIIDELGGFGKYQKRLLYILLSKYKQFSLNKSTLPLAIVENEIRNKVMTGNPSSNILGPLFLIMPFPMLHQMFVLHSPEHSCNHPPIMEAENMGINQTIWQVWKIIKNI